MLTSAFILAFAGLLKGAFASDSRKHIKLKIASDGELLAFKPDHLICPAGASVHLTFYHTGKNVSRQIIVGCGLGQDARCGRAQAALITHSHLTSILVSRDVSPGSQSTREC
jgi:hypothetical protein